MNFLIDYVAYALYMLPGIIMCVGAIFIGKGIFLQFGLSPETRQKKQAIQLVRRFYFRRGCALVSIGLVTQIPTVIITYPLLPPLNQDIVTLNVVVIGFLLFSWIQQARHKRLHQNSQS